MKELILYLAGEYHTLWKIHLYYEVFSIKNVWKINIKIFLLHVTYNQDIFHIHILFKEPFKQELPYYINYFNLKWWNEMTTEHLRMRCFQNHTMDNTARFHKWYLSNLWEPPFLSLLPKKYFLYSTVYQINTYGRPSQSNLCRVQHKPFLKNSSSFLWQNTVEK